MSELGEFIGGEIEPSRRKPRGRAESDAGVPTTRRHDGGEIVDPHVRVPVVAEIGWEDEEQERAFSLLDYWGIVVKWRWLILGAAAVGVAIGFVITLLTTPIYRGTATIQIDHEPAKVTALQTQDQSDYFDAEEFYQTQYALLKSRSLAQRVAANMGLGYDQAFLNQTGAKTLKSVARESAAPRATGDSVARLDRATNLVQGRLKIEPVHGSRLVKISYESPNPGIAAKIANGVAENFIQSNLERRYDASSYARQFLLDRLNQTRQKLEDTEKAMVAYAAKNQIITIGSGDASKNSAEQGQTSLAETDLAAINASLAGAVSNRIQAEQRWRTAQSTPDLSMPEVLSNPTIQTLVQNRDALKAQYDQDRKLYKPDFPSMVDNKAKLDAMDRQITTLSQSIKNSLKNQYDVALRQEQSLNGAVNQQKASVIGFRERSIQYNILQRELDTSRSLYDGLLQRYKEVGVAGGIGTNNISVVDDAKTPRSPFKPVPMQNMGFFGAIFLALGAMAAFLLERFDVSVKVPEDIEKRLQLALLGTVPKIPRDQMATNVIQDPRSVLSEAYYSIRTALQFSTQAGVPANLLVTSARPHEGKSTTSVSIARAFARIGMRVLLIDGDMRDPSLHKLLGRDNTVGLSNILSGGVVPAPAVQETDQENLMFLACGPRPPNPAELLSGDKLRTFVEAAREQFDLVIIDGPPVLGLADAPLLASWVLGTVVVVEAGVTKRELAKMAIRRLRVGRGHLVGAILNKFDIRKAGYTYGYIYGHGSGYGYGYEYGNRDSQRTRKAPRLFGIQLPDLRPGGRSGG